MSSPAILHANPQVINQYLSQLSDEELQQFGLMKRPQGAPADFGGPVFPNPDNVKVSADTESGEEPTKLPTGVSFHDENFRGPMPRDVSNPPQAQLLPTGSKTVDYDALAQQHGAQPAVDYDALAQQHGAQVQQESPKQAEKPMPEDYLTRAEDLIHESAQTLGREAVAAGGMITGLPSAIYHAAVEPPTPEELKLLGVKESSGPVRVANFIQRMIGGGQTAEAAAFYKRYVQATPDQRRSIEDQMLSVAPEAIGTGAGAVLLPKVIEKAPATARGAVEVAQKVPEVVSRAMEKAQNVTPKQAAQVAGGTAGAISGHGTLSAPGAYYGAKTAGRAVEAVLGKERANAPLLRKPTPVYPGAPEPTLPPEVQQARPIGIGGAAPPAEPSAGLGQIPVKTPGELAPTPPTPAELLNKPMSPTELKEALDRPLNESVGATPLERGKPIYQRPQTPISAQPTKPVTLPEGFTPVKSSVLEGYKYDSAAREFEYITKDGQQYVRGDVGPEAKAAFDAKLAETNSYGKAFHALRNHPEGGVGQFKVINGERVPVKPGTLQTETGEVVPKSEAGMQEQSPADILKKPPANVDLTDLLQKSVEQVQAKSMRPNASGESRASQEAINRAASEKVQNIKRYRIDTRSGKEMPLVGVDAVDAVAGPYDVIVKRGPQGEEVLDQGSRARLYRRR